MAPKIGAHNCYCPIQTEMGQQRAATRLHGLQHYPYGAPPVVIVVAGDAYILLAAEDGFSSLGVHVNALFDPPCVRARAGEPMARHGLASLAKGQTDTYRT
jgi:hypothetical protein